MVGNSILVLNDDQATNKVPDKASTDTKSSELDITKRCSTSTLTKKEASSCLFIWQAIRHTSFLHEIANVTEVPWRISIKSKYDLVL